LRVKVIHLNRPIWNQWTRLFLTGLMISNLNLPIYNQRLRLATMWNCMLFQMQEIQIRKIQVQIPINNFFGRKYLFIRELSKAGFHKKHESPSVMQQLTQVQFSCCFMFLCFALIPRITLCVQFACSLRCLFCHLIFALSSICVPYRHF
jgi:hypothetical protein